VNVPELHRWVRRILRVILFSAASFVLVAGAFFVVLRWDVFRNACDRFDTPLAEISDGRSVVYRLEACTIIGTSVSESVDLVSPSGHHKTVFSFASAASFPSYDGIPVTGPVGPSATWTAPRSLKISIGTVAAILEQRSEIDDVQVTYDIGTNLHMERK
jgi:hypothetical protein